MRGVVHNKPCLLLFFHDQNETKNEKNKKKTFEK